MRPYMQSAPPSRTVLWTSYIMSALPVLLLLMSGTMKFIRPPGFAEGLEHMGWSEGQMVNLGIVEIVCVIIYLIPQTSILGAILLTGYLGGAVATHVRVGDPFFIPILAGALLWGGIFLRDARLRALMPYRTKM